MPVETLPPVVVVAPLATPAHQPLPPREPRAQSPAPSSLALDCVLDPDGSVVAMADHSGGTAELSRGCKFWECFPGRLNQPVRKQVRAACRRAAGGEAVREELSLSSGDAARIIQLQILPVRDTQGRVSHLITSAVQACAGAVTEGRDRGEAQQARAFLAAIVDSTDDAVISKTLDGRITSWNLAAQRLFGYTPAEAIGQQVSLIIPPELMDEERTILDRLRRGERIDHYETERVARDGRRLLISLTISPLLDGEGRIIGASKVARDITERRRNEATLARHAREQAALYQFTDRLHRALCAEEMYEAALDAIAGALGCERASILLRDEAGVMHFVAWRGLSDGYRRAVEGHSPWTEEAVDPQPICVSSGSAAEMSDPLRSAVNAEGIGAVAYIPLMSSGALIGNFVVYHQAPRSFSREDTDFALLLARQLAFGLERSRAAEQRQLADRAMRESERRFRELIDALPAAVYTTDAQGYLTHFNPAAARFSGRTPTIGVDRWCVTVRLFAADGTPMAHEDCPMAVALREGRPIEGDDVIAERPDGTRLWFQPYPTPVHDKDGNIVGGVNMLVDTTERRRIEEALRESEERYRRLVGLLPVAVYTCDSPSGLITFYNEQAAELWGQAPRVGDTDQRFCGSFKLWKPDGAPLPHDQTPMAVALREGCKFRHQDVIIERPDGSRINVLVNIDPIFNADGQLVGAVNAFQDVTPHRQAEEALRESERRFRLMADAAPVLIWVSDENKRGIYFNQRWLAFTGRSHEQEIGDGWLQSIHPDDVLSVSTACRAAFERRAPFRIEFRMRRADGEYRWLLDHGVPRFNQAGDLAGYIGSCIDVTEHREAELALRQSEERFRELANGIDQFAWTSDSAGRATWFNQRWIDYTGCTLADAGGEGWKKVHHPHHLQRIIEGQRAAFAAGEPWEDVYPIRSRDGSYRWFLSRAMPIRDEAGRVIRWLGTNTDVTEQRVAEEALRENERRMSTLLSNLPGMVYRYRYDEAWTVEFVSQGAQELTGYDPQEFVLGRRRWTQVIQPDDADRVKAAVHTSIEQHEPFELEYRIRHRDGGERWVWEQGEAVFDESGKAVALEGFVTDITERRNAEQQLRESEGRFRRLANAAPVLIWISGTDKSLTWFNKPWLDFVGRSMEDEIGIGWLENVHPDDLDHCLGTYIRSFDARRPFTMEYRLRRHDGEYRWVLDHGIPMVGDDGAFTGYLGSCIDITERRLTEAALKSKEAELQLVASATPVLLARCTRDMRYRFANRALAALFGKSPDEIIGKHIPEVIGQAAFEKIKPYVDRVLAGETVEYESELRYSTGVRWVQVNYMPERDEHADVVGWVASVIDITERRRAEEALRESEARYKASIDTALDCVVTMDFNARITGFNPAAERTFGYSRDEVIGRELAEVLIPPELRGDHRRGMLRWIEGHESRLFGHRIETTGIRKDGSRILIELSMARIPGDPPSVTAFLRDVTEQKRVAESLRQSNEALEKRVAERTAELQHRANQLARLTSELTLTERRERQRLARVLHDHLQQLLASGKLGLEFIARSSDDTRRAEWIEHARTCIDEAIEASRSLSVELCPPVLHESGLAAACEWLARWMKDKHGLEVQLSVDPRANPDREDVRTLVFESIRELLFNITKHAGVQKATLQLLRHGGDRLRVIIRDRGAGFNPEQLSESREHMGYGLLNIRERLALLGGSFEIKSAVGEGSCFTLIAPRSGRSDLRPAAPEPPEAQPTRVAKLSARAASELDDRIRVMVVDDHAVMREGLCALLAEEPTLEVVGEASDGIEAIEQAKTLQPDIILMDYSMPAMNGVEATQVIRRDLPKVQVIALSMHREKERARAMIEAGAVAYFNKSDDSDALIKAIARFGSRAAARAPDEPTL